MTQQSGYCTVMAPSLGEKAKWLQALAKQQESKHRDATRTHSEKSKPVSTQVHLHMYCYITDVLRILLTLLLVPPLALLHVVLLLAAPLLAL
jgi:hypothetical protein